jgi:hypothetical protein
MQARTNNPRAGSEPNYEGMGPWANHDRRIVVDEHNIDDRLCPNAQKTVRKVCGNWEFPIVRENRILMCFKIHRCPNSHRIAVLPASYLGLLASDRQAGSNPGRPDSHHYFRLADIHDKSVSRGQKLSWRALESA